MVMRRELEKLFSAVVDLDKASHALREPELGDGELIARAALNEVIWLVDHAVQRAQLIAESVEGNNIGGKKCARKDRLLKIWGNETGYNPDTPQSKAQWQDSWERFLNRMLEDGMISATNALKWRRLPPSAFPKHLVWVD